MGAGCWEYQVVRCSHMGDLSQTVSQMLNAGWMCVGGVAAWFTGGPTYMQAMARYVKPKIEGAPDASP